jgi:hypothetical protein
LIVKKKRLDEQKISVTRNRSFISVTLLFLNRYELLSQNPDLSPMKEKMEKNHCGSWQTLVNSGGVDRPLFTYVGVKRLLGEEWHGITIEQVRNMIVLLT